MAVSGGSLGLRAASQPLFWEETSKSFRKSPNSLTHKMSNCRSAQKLTDWSLPVQHLFFSCGRPLEVGRAVWGSVVHARNQLSCARGCWCSFDGDDGGDDDDDDDDADAFANRLDYVPTNITCLVGCLKHFHFPGVHLCGYFSVAGRPGSSSKTSCRTPARGTWRLHKVPRARGFASRPGPLRWVPEEYGGSVLLYAILFNFPFFNIYIYIKYHYMISKGVVEICIQ